MKKTIPILLSFILVSLTHIFYCSAQQFQQYQHRQFQLQQQLEYQKNFYVEGFKAQQSSYTVLRDTFIITNNNNEQDEQKVIPDIDTNLHVNIVEHTECKTKEKQNNDKINKYKQNFLLFIAKSQSKNTNESTKSLKQKFLQSLKNDPNYFAILTKIDEWKFSKKQLTEAQKTLTNSKKISKKNQRINDDSDHDNDDDNNNESHEKIYNDALIFYTAIPPKHKSSDVQELNEFEMQELDEFENYTNQDFRVELTKTLALLKHTQMKHKNKTLEALHLNQEQQQSNTLIEQLRKERSKLQKTIQKMHDENTSLKVEFLQKNFKATGHIDAEKLADLVSFSQKPNNNPNIDIFHIANNEYSCLDDKLTFCGGHLISAINRLSKNQLISITQKKISESNGCQFLTLQNNITNEIFSRAIFPATWNETNLEKKLTDTNNKLINSYESDGKILKHMKTPDNVILRLVINPKTNYIITAYPLEYVPATASSI